MSKRLYQRGGWGRNGGRTHNGVEDIYEAIHHGQEFNSGALTAERLMERPIHRSGRLPAEYAQRFYDDAPTYVLFSYATPIAWRTDQGEWVVPDVKYSVTTGRHQSIARVGIRKSGQSYTE